jgi:hypothetical protein
MSFERRSKSGEAARAAQRERLDKLTARERIQLALRLGRRARALARRNVVLDDRSLKTFWLLAGGEA